MLFKNKNPNLASSKPTIDISTLKVVAIPGLNQSEQSGRPWRLSSGGVSDHFPLTLQLNLGQ
jgi:hypothetical protein